MCHGIDKKEHVVRVCAQKKTFVKSGGVSVFDALRGRTSCLATAGRTALGQEKK